MWQTDWNRNHVELLRTRLAEFDSAKFKLGDTECKFCRFIVPERNGGAAITMAECAICGKHMTFGNPNVDKLCPECAVENHLCKHCGGDVIMRHRRSKRAYEKGVELNG